jgi:hypothetical protein
MHLMAKKIDLRTLNCSIESLEETIKDIESGFKFTMERQSKKVLVEKQSERKVIKVQKPPEEENIFAASSPKIDPSRAKNPFLNL